MTKKDIIPAVLEYQGEIARIANGKKQLMPNIQCYLRRRTS